MVRAGDLKLLGASLLLFIGFGQAALADRVEEHLQLCLDEAQAKICEAEKARFRAAYAGAYRGNYQDQRNVAFCLKSGCGGVQRNPTLACAWRVVILMSGSSRVDETDQGNFKLACGSLSDAEAATATAQADRLRQTIRKR